MDEKIKELARKAGLEDQVTPFDEFDNLELQAFAELIIEECIDVVSASDPSPKTIVHEPYRAIMNNIVEHFGIAKE